MTATDGEAQEWVNSSLVQPHGSKLYAAHAILTHQDLGCFLALYHGDMGWWWEVSDGLGQFALVSFKGRMEVSVSPSEEIQKRATNRVMQWNTEKQSKETK